MYLEFTFLDFSKQEFRGITAIYKDDDFSRDIKHELTKLYSGELIILQENGKRTKISGDLVRSIRFS